MMELKQEKQRAEEANAAKSAFMSTMSHEIRTPMNAIVGMCELILRDDVNETVRENCFNIQSSSRSLLSIINDILDFSKIEAGKIELIEETFNIASTINDVINMAMTRKGEKNIEIIVRVDPTIPKGLIGDEIRIRQIIINLLTNAIKFTQKGCVILKITQSRQGHNMNLNVSVKDTGIGISEENIEKLFTSFQRIDTKKNRSVEGTGLGLAISKRLITQMHGFINVFSTYGEGSEFRFVIPLKISDPEPFIQLEATTGKNVAVYLDWKKYNHQQTQYQYNKLIHELGEKLNVNFTIFDTVEALESAMASGTYTHCFTAQDEYIKHSNALSEIAEKYQLVVIQDRFQPIDLPGHIKSVFKPFYALTFAAIMNNEKFVMDIHGPKIFTSRFIAPEAKILVVDDNPTNLKVAVGLMKPYNMKIITVSNGQAAIDALQTKDFDIVFMDHMMPEMDGVEATQMIRSLHDKYYQEVPIIALTANAVNGAREMFLSTGFNDFLAKPIEVSVLDKMLRSWLPPKLLITTSTVTKNEDKSTKSPETANSKTGNDTANEFINYERGLKYAGGNQEIYCDILKTYFASSQQYNESLIAHFDSQDWQNYTIKAHALKSSSLSIGAEEFSEFAKKLELAGKEGNYEVILNEHNEFLKLYNKVMDAVQSYLLKNGYPLEQPPETTEQDLQEITIEQFTEKVAHIIDACNNFDGDTIMKLAEELCSCKLDHKALSMYFTKVKEYAEDFEYEKALEATQNAEMKIKEAE